MYQMHRLMFKSRVSRNLFNSSVKERKHNGLNKQNKQKTSKSNVTKTAKFPCVWLCDFTKIASE